MVGAILAHPRRLQQDCLLDGEDEFLTRRQWALRVRHEDGRGVLTFKGPPQPGLVKLREEIETAVASPETLLLILERLGLRVSYRSEKYREEFTANNAVIAIDETPVGVFVEIEGAEERIHALATALGKSTADYVTTSYRELYLEHCRAGGLAATNMLF